MSRFQFRLETLLKVRVADRQQKRVELAEAYQAEQLLREQADQLSQERKVTRGVARASAASGTINVDSLRSVHRHALLLETQAKLLEQSADQLGEEIGRRRAALMEADRQVRILEQLREKQQESHQAELWKREQKELDEVALRDSWKEPE